MGLLLARNQVAYDYIIFEEAVMNLPMPEIAVKPRISENISQHSMEVQIISEIPLRVKGFLAFAAVVIYAVLLTTFTFNKKAELVNEFEHLQTLYKTAEGLRQLDATAFHIVMAVFMSPKTNDPKVVMKRFLDNFELLRNKNAELAASYPLASVNLSGIEQAVDQAFAHPSSEGLAAMNSELLKVKIKITQLIDESTQEQKASAEKFHMLWDSAALASLLFGVVGLFLLGAIIGLFFTRLTDDLHALKARALGIIKGERNIYTPVTRNDEVGELMQAVNQMATALDEREKELVIARQKFFHREKMAAVGALAAGVAHEIGNPIAAMSGVLQEMVDEEKSGQRNMNASDRLTILQTQIQRLSAITREISGFSAAQPVGRQLLDLNGLVRTTVGLMAYDKRMHQIDLQLQLDNQLPAIYGVADQLTQVVMNLLINAADALATKEDSFREIILRSEVLDGVCLTVTDNGSGMDQATLDRAFEAFYTTKSKGTGLGLSLCYSIINGHDGTIEIHSAPGMGTTVRICLPVPAEDGGDTL
jgi:two-component system NtrC family sensor kinase